MRLKRRVKPPKKKKKEKAEKLNDIAPDDLYGYDESKPYGKK